MSADPMILVRVRLSTKAYAMLARRAERVNRATEIEAGYLLQAALVDLIRRAETARTIRARINRLAPEIKS